WLITADNRLERVDPKSGVRLAKIDPRVDFSEAGGPGGVLGGALWVAARTAVSRIDVQTDKGTAGSPPPGAKLTADVQGGYLGGAYGTFMNGKLWVSNPAGLFEVDPVAGTAKLFPLRISPMSQFGDLYVVNGDGSLWMRTGDTSVARID